MAKDIPFLSQKILGAVLVFSFLSTSCGKPPEASAPPAVPVKIQSLETATVINSTEFVGNLEASNRVSIAPQIEGRVLKILVNFGDRVSQSTPLIQLEPTQQQEQVNSQLAEVNVQKAALEQAVADLRTAQAQKANAAAQVEQQKAALESNKATLKLSEVTLERTKFLATEGADSQQSLDDQQRNYQASLADYNAQQEAVNATIQSLQAADAQVNQAKANISAQKAQIARAQADVGVSTQSLKFNRVLAPIDGDVGNITVREGDFVTIGQQLGTLTDNRTMELNINVPVEYAHKLKLGIPVEIVKADGTTGVKGDIKFIDSTINNATQSILTKVFFKNDGNLRDQQYVKVRFIWDKQPGVLIPVTAVTTVGAQKFVFVAEEGKTPDGKQAQIAKQKPVVLGNIQGQEYQVVSGITSGEKLIVSGILNLRDGVTINEEAKTSEKLQ